MISVDDRPVPCAGACGRTASLLPPSIPWSSTQSDGGRAAAVLKTVARWWICGPCHDAGCECGHAFGTHHDAGACRVCGSGSPPCRAYRARVLTVTGTCCDACRGRGHIPFGAAPGPGGAIPTTRCDACGGFGWTTAPGPAPPPPAQRSKSLYPVLRAPHEERAAQDGPYASGPGIGGPVHVDESHRLSDDERMRRLHWMVIFLMDGQPEADKPEADLVVEELRDGRRMPRSPS